MDRVSSTNQFMCFYCIINTHTQTNMHVAFLRALRATHPSLAWKRPTRAKHEHPRGNLRFYTMVSHFHIQLLCQCVDHGAEIVPGIICNSKIEQTHRRGRVFGNEIRPLAWGRKAKSSKA